MLVNTINGEVSVDGDKAHPANYGRLCSKGYALADTLSDTNRLLRPEIHGSPVSWNAAIECIAEKFQTVIDTHGPESIAFYVSGQLLTEDYYVVNKFVKGYLGTANIDTNSRLCMASSVAGHKRAFGSDTVPGCYEDLELADVIVLTGSNLAWCHPVLFQRILKAKAANPAMKIVVIDPRKTATVDQSDLHLQLKAGGESDLVLFTGLLQYLAQKKCLDHDWIDRYTNNLIDALAAAKQWTVDKVAGVTGLTKQELIRFYSLYQQHEKIVTVYSQGVNQSHKGTDTVNSIINVHLATGRIGREGCGPFSITGQPNAMGGREVGGLANMLACHMDIENKKHQSVVQRYWNSPNIAQSLGLKAIDLFDAVKSGKIKALWVMATNPADSMPKADEVSKAIAACPFVVVSDVVRDTDTTNLADVLLPARAWSEKDGTVTNSERRISRQRAFRTAPVDTRPDWWAVSRVAQHMGFTDAFSFERVSEIFSEYAGLSGFENHGSRDFDISELQELNEEDYDSLTPVQWPLKPLASSGTKRMFGRGGFYSVDGKANFVPIVVETKHERAGESPVNEQTEKRSARATNGNDTTGGKSIVRKTTSSRIASDKISQIGFSERTFLLNTGRIRDQWHTMTRTGASARLSAHLSEPFVEIHPLDAAAMRLQEAAIMDVISEHGTIQVRSLVTDRVAPGNLFIPMHWSNQYAANARVNTLVHSARDPVSGQPALKNQRVKMRMSVMGSYGFMVSRKQPDLRDCEYWSSVPIADGWKTEFASKSPPDELTLAIEEIACESLIGAEQIQFSDARSSSFRSCWFAGNQLHQATFISSKPVELARTSVASLLVHSFDSSADQIAVLSGVGLSDSEDGGAIVCSCMQVGINSIQRSIGNGCFTVQSVGDSCGAGTQCGTCRSEITRLIENDTVSREKVSTEKVVASV